jgi:hypothetical protein
MAAEAGEDRTEAEASTVAGAVSARAAEVSVEAAFAVARRHPRSLAIREGLPLRRFPDMRGPAEILLVLSAARQVAE